MAALKEAENPPRGTSAGEGADEVNVKTFRKWTWRPADGRFAVTIQFSKEQSEGAKIQLAFAALEETLRHLREATHGKGR